VFDKTVAIRGSLLTDEQRVRLLEVAAKCPVQRVLEGGSVFATTTTPETARAGRSAA
jgi:putative redox protein